MNQRNRADSPTKVCTEDGCVNPLRARGLCSTHYNKAMGFHSGNRNASREVRQRTLRTRTQQRRAKRTDPNADRIDRDVVGERDGWRCGICRRRIDYALAYPHPRSASLDHIVPLSLGGLHLLTNVRIAHLGCNHQRSNTVGDVQPLLVG